jgi:hypothetical protein
MFCFDKIMVVINSCGGGGGGVVKFAHSCGLSPKG